VTDLADEKAGLGLFLGKEGFLGGFWRWVIWI